ncbi:MAG: 2-isopropylmalate synthase, partial [Bacillota bacterium]|nr:2-isopropylmalate synthase [Bacillota bacterium]
TLRDGEQTPGINFNFQEKTEIAQQLGRLKVDVIEAGFPVISSGDMEAVRSIAKIVKGPVICGFARPSIGDIDAVREALAPAKRRRIHICIATSDLHMKYKLNMTRKQVLEAVDNHIRYAAKYFDDIEFSGEDAFRSDPEFLKEVYQLAIDRGATVLNLPDTVGYALPSEFGSFVKEIRESVPDSDKVTWSCHCHNDLGLGVANALAAIENGIRQVECTVNGLGERAGNTAMEELVMALNTRKQLLNMETTLEKKEIGRTCRLVSTLSGMSIPRNKAITGRNAFLHESGIHQDGVLKNRATYEIMDPTSIGIYSEEITLGKHSGRHGFKEHLEKLGFSLSDSDFREVYKNFKSLADRKKDISDRDIEVLIEEQVRAVPEYWKIEYFHISSVSQMSATATVKLRSKEKVIEEASCGDGPISAIFNAINRCIGLEVKLTQYSLNAVTGGTDAIGEALTQIDYEGESYNGRGISTDILEASAKSYVNAINRALYVRASETGEN